MKTKPAGSIGVFDSGFGGLLVLKDIVRLLPAYDYVYLGDTARVPYGNRSPEVVYEFTRQAVDFLFSKGCELIIIACNTASAEALRRIQQEHLPETYGRTKRVLGVVVPAAEEAVAKTENARVGLIATEGTVNSGAFRKELIRRKKSIKVFSQSAPLLVPLIETGEYASEPAKLILKKYLSSLFAKKIDTLILGCTHYGILKREIQKLAGKRVLILSEGTVVARKLREYLLRHPEIDSRLSRHSRRVFYTTDLTRRFAKLGSRFFGSPVRAIRADLER